ncbi:MAG: DUF2235 domain-containing protein, partial [Gammaproteobacteria bacterium]|nr:DUF2235 domain-containing protein [Gammaproteobacteria bacterium]
MILGGCSILRGWVRYGLLLGALVLCPPSFAAGPVYPHCASPGGTPCQGGGPASLGNTSGTPQGVGNPLHVASGNKHQREVDMPPLPGVLGLELVRYYNSAYSAAKTSPTIMGRGWRLSYETELYALKTTVQILQADGTRLIFLRDPRDPSRYATRDPAHGTVFLQQDPDGRDQYLWVWPNGRRLYFDARGQLSLILAPTGEFVSLTRDPDGYLVRVTDPQGRRLSLQYAARDSPGFRGVRRITSPVGRFTYRYGHPLPKGATADPRVSVADLIAVETPEGTRRHYHYEDPRHPTRMTGLSVSGPGHAPPRRLATWAYDAQGRAILSIKGARPTQGYGIEEVRLDFGVPGQTRLTNSRGQVTTYTHTIINNDYRLLEVRGPGCASCGPGNRRYRYDAVGRLIEQTTLTPQGEPLRGTRTVRDAHGRVIEVSTIEYRAGQPVSEQIQVRYAYGPDLTLLDVNGKPLQDAAGKPLDRPDMQPRLIARPSRVAGKEHRVHLTYTAAGQPLAVTERGWRPATGGEPPMRLERTTRYRYTRINGRSLLTEIDGPLPNGPRNAPSDSDITRISWDGRGDYVTAMSAPGGFTSTFHYDGTGRVAQVTNKEGLKTSFTYDAHHRPIAIARGGMTQTTRYDARGNIIETGTRQGETYRAQARYGFDSAGRNLWVASHLGVLERHRYDTEGRLLETTTQSARFQQTYRYAYDGLGRLIAVTDPAGGTQRIAYNDRGLPAVFTDALGREQRYRYDAADRLIEVLEAANTVQARWQNTASRFEYDAMGEIAAVIAPNGATTRYLQDDFGRLLSIVSPDSGTLRQVYDAADRRLESRDAQGHRTLFEYDPAGRLLRRTVVDGRTRQATTTAWKYSGRRLVAVEHPGQQERYRYDSRGRLMAKTVSLQLVQGGRATYHTRFQYDATGQLEAVSLPDGSLLHYRRNGQNQIVALTRGRIATPWLAWLLPEQRLVKDIERDLVGLKRYTYGNGIEAEFQRSREGALARVVYRRPAGTAAASHQATALQRMLGIRDAAAAEDPIAPATGDGDGGGDGEKASSLLKNIPSSLSRRERVGVRASEITPLPTPSPYSPVQGDRGLFQQTAGSLPGAFSLPADPRALMDHRYLWDLQGNLLYVQSKERTGSYAYDALDRLIGAVYRRNRRDTAWRYFYDGAGNRLLAQQGIGDQADLSTSTIKAVYAPGTNRWQRQADYDADGKPRRIGRRGYRWGAGGTLIEVRQEKAGRLQPLARYRYNHRGERIAKIVYSRDSGSTQVSHAAHPGTAQHFLYADRRLAAELNAAGRLTRQYLYLGDQPLAVIDTPQGAGPASEDESFLGRIAHDLATVFNAWFGEDESVAYLHPNHLGAVELATDAHGRAVWRADYSPFGQLIRAPARNGTRRFTLNLRLPGQYEDEETGLYYNDQRYYDPEQGRYLTPDPLGLRGGINAYAYAANNPLRYIDPWGLILFAFDGTANTYTEEHGKDDFSNVYKFYRDLYNDGARFYITGVGARDPDSGIENPWYKGGKKADIAKSLTGKERIAYMIQQFENYVRTAKEDIIDIDVIGFSRGAAQGRDFVNQLVARTSNGVYSFRSEDGAQYCHKVNFRFLGLWDTVLSSHTGSYNLIVPDAVKYVAHAVAVNEHRTLFPGESIFSSPSASSSAGVRIERGFIGAHSDIGGGYAEGDLSDVTLNWIYQQAQLAGIKLVPQIPDQYAVVSNPIWHDSNTKFMGSGFDDEGDRRFNYQDGTWYNQKVAPVPGLNYISSLPFLRPYASPQPDAYG